MVIKLNEKIFPRFDETSAFVHCRCCVIESKFSSTGNRFRLDNSLERKIVKGLVKALCKRGRDKIIDYASGNHESWLPRAIYYFVKHVLQHSVTVQQIWDMELQIPDLLHIHADSNRFPWSSGDGCRLNEIV